MNLSRFQIAASVLALSLASFLMPRAHGLVGTPTSPGFGQDRDDWDSEAPREWSELQRRGFHDGIDGARKDYGNHRQPDVDNRDEYRRPNVDPQFWGPYREGFRRGYSVAMSHLLGGPDWRMRAPERPWDAPPDQLNDIQRRGFLDGIEGARKDLDNHRRPDVNNREEFRRPNLDPNLVDAYRDGFARGYQVAISRLMNGPQYQSYQPPPPPPPPPAWDAPRQEWNEIQRRGFHDGIEGARKDFGNHRQPNVNNREEYRHPDDVPGEMRDAYRDAFREGYDRAMRHLLGDHDHDRDDHDHDRN
jgi:hypothetical protein